MSDNTENPPEDAPKKNLSDSFKSGEAMDYGDHLFKVGEFDLYSNKVTYETFIFHSKKVDYEAIDHLEYNPDDYSVTIVRKDDRRLDLGIKIEWMVRPYFSKAKEINIVRTRDGQSIDGLIAPLVVTGKVR